jgi:RimJ/RimL family protein N-acetyltransferase
MRHDLRVDGAAFRLRPAEISDAAFIASLRSDPAVNRFIHATSPDPARQAKWMEDYFKRDGDYYFIVERIRRRSSDKDVREGTIGIYDIDAATGAAEWGRWVLRPGSLAGLESAVLVCRAGFDYLKLSTLYCRTIVQNRHVVQFHESFGLYRHGIIRDFVLIGEDRFDVVDQRMTREMWDARRADLERKVTRMAAAVNR